ncbi:hypothetical protein ACXR0O_25020 [Verrucomicrobiota bacterium sgz303538]
MNKPKQKHQDSRFRGVVFDKTIQRFRTQIKAPAIKRWGSSEQECAAYALAVYQKVRPELYWPHTGLNKPWTYKYLAWIPDTVAGCIVLRFCLKQSVWISNEDRENIQKRAWFIRDQKVLTVDYEPATKQFTETPMDQYILGTNQHVFHIENAWWDFRRNKLSLIEPEEAEAPELYFPTIKDLQRHFWDDPYPLDTEEDYAGLPDEEEEEKRKWQEQQKAWFGSIHEPYFPDGMDPDELIGKISPTGRTRGRPKGKKDSEPRKRKKRV